jgi:hypothetical protein
MWWKPGGQLPGISHGYAFGLSHVLLSSLCSNITTMDIKRCNVVLSGRRVSPFRKNLTLASPARKEGAADFSKTLAPISQASRQHIPEDHNVNPNQSSFLSDRSSFMPIKGVLSYKFITVNSVCLITPWSRMREWLYSSTITGFGTRCRWVSGRLHAHTTTRYNTCCFE